MAGIIGIFGKVDQDPQPVRTTGRTWRIWVIACLCALGVAVRAVGQAALGPPREPPSSNWESPILLQDPFTTVNEKTNGEAESKAAKFRPAHIRDNAFLVEEASNQEPGVVQHIFNWVHSWDRTPGGHTRDLVFAYTMELPLGSQTHQFSFVTQLLSSFEKPLDGPADHQGGVGDTFLNYRYQLLADDAFLWCAPRFSLIVPTGDDRFGLGTGQLGYQFNLPVSKYGEDFDFHFNAGLTFTPNVSAALPALPRPPVPGEPAEPSAPRFSPRHDLHGYNLGGSIFWKPKTNLHFFCEFLALWSDEINDSGFRESNSQVFANPGVRYAICQLEDVEWVVGVSVPVGLTRDTPDIGVFFYMSVEHTFRKRNTRPE
jgi:hypothetical protein